jgi:PPOX class probable F420-dependent enzyme
MMDPRVREILTGRRNAWLATLMADGSPQLTPVWIDVDGADVVLSTNEGTVKVANMRRHPKVAVAIEAEEDRYEVVTIRGHVVSIEPDTDLSRVDSLSWRHDDKPWDEDTEAGQRLLVRIRPERITLLRD